MRRTADKSIPHFFDALKAVKNDDRSLLLVTNGYFEILTDVLISAKCRNKKRILEDGRSYPYSVKLVILSEVGAIDIRLFQLLDAFRKLRNRAAHEAFFSVEVKDYQFFIDGAGYTPINLYACCSALCVAYWNHQVRIFGPELQPELFK